MPGNSTITSVGDEEKNTKNLSGDKNIDFTHEIKEGKGERNMTVEMGHIQQNWKSKYKIKKHAILNKSNVY